MDLEPKGGNCSRSHKRRTSRNGRGEARYSIGVPCDSRRLGGSHVSWNTNPRSSPHLRWKRTPAFLEIPCLRSSESLVACRIEKSVFHKSLSGLIIRIPRRRFTLQSLF